MPIYAIGDIHGQKTMLDQALNLITSDGGDDAHIVFIGDYTDRGPNSKSVIDTLIAGKKSGKNWTFLKGNHDRMFCDFVASGTEHDPKVKSNISWVNSRLGGVTTLASYGVTGDPHFSHPLNGFETLTHYTRDGQNIAPADIVAEARAAVPQAHLDFIANLPLTLETEDLIFVHAGLRPNVAIADQDVEDLLWIRDGFLETDHDFGRLVVHGHTALEHPTHFGTRIDIDGGAGYGRPLVPVVFEGRDCWTLTPAGRISLVP
ncbi:MAG: serine/threonine protein phosphatase [Yoonia sp.]|nr:serine/threonine protein phosphatase [Yoonia sp.]